MAESFKDMSVSLLPSNPMRAVRRKRPNWPLRIAVGLLLIAGDALLIGNKEKLLSKMGFENVPALPMPSAAMSADDQALYWAYALYDAGKFRARFRFDGEYAINRGHARRELESLLPRVSPATLGEISAYGSVAFRGKGRKVSAKSLPAQ